MEHDGLIKTCAKFHQLLTDSCDDDAEIRKLCYEVLSKEKVDGDTYGVPNNVDLVEMLVKKIKQGL